VAVSLGEDSHRAWDLPFIHAVASYLNAAQGKWSTAAEHVDAAQRAAQATPLPLCFYYASIAAAHLAWARGEWDALLLTLAPLQDRPEGGIAAGLGRRILLSLTAEGTLATGQLDDTADLLDKLEADTGKAPEDGTRVDLWRLRGALEHALDRPAEAEVAFVRGKDAAEKFDSPLSRGLLELGRGRFLRQSAGRREAIAALRAARETFAGLGAHPFVRQCDSELTACGVRSGRPDGENHFGLTAREDVVARLVAGGKSNREVAEELFLSTKAIEYHLGNVFAKANVRSRHELAARLATSGTEPH
jgi:DNA-binding CsgD family transcriptional regulator